MAARLDGGLVGFLSGCKQGSEADRRTDECVPQRKPKQKASSKPRSAVPTLAQSGEAGNGQETSSRPAVANQGADGIPTPLPSAPLDDGQWLKDLARVLIASIGPKAEVVENSAKGMAPPGLSKVTADTDKQIAKLAARACNDYGGKVRLDRGLAIRSIANISGLERRPG